MAASSAKPLIEGKKADGGLDSQKPFLKRFHPKPATLKRPPE